MPEPVPPPPPQQVHVGYQLLATYGDDVVKRLLVQHLSGLAQTQPRTTWWHLTDQDTGEFHEAYADTKWTDASQQRLVTILALATEWRTMTGDDPPAYDGTATYTTFPSGEPD